MAVNAVKGANIPTRDPGGPSALAPLGVARAPSITHALDYATFPPASDIGSTYDIVDLPSNTIIGVTSFITLPNLGPGVTLNLGDANYPAGLWNGQAASVAAEVRVLVNKTVRDYGRPLWQLLGYPADPKTALRLRLIVAGAQTGAAGDVGVNLHGAVA